MMTVLLLAPGDLAIESVRDETAAAGAPRAIAAAGRGDSDRDARGSRDPDQQLWYKKSP